MYGRTIYATAMKLGSQTGDNIEPVLFEKKTEASETLVS
jgi:hypothetical protein